MRAHLTKSFLKSVKPSAKPYEIRDDRVIGLLLRVQPTGKMSFYFEYRRGRRLKLGPSDIGADQARDLAVSYMGAVSRGEDPRKAQRAKDAPRFIDFVNHIYSPWASTHLRTSKKVLERLRSNAKKFHAKQLSEISPEGFEQWRAQRLKAGRKRTTVNRDLDDVRGVLSKALEWGYIKQNPLAETKKLKTDKSGTVRFLRREEEASLLRHLEAREERLRIRRKQHNVWRNQRGHAALPPIDTDFADHLKPMMLVALHTGLRQGELFDLLWSDIDLSQKLLSVRGEVSKNLQTRHVPLNVTVLDVLQRWQSQSTRSGLVFPGKNGKRFDNIRTAWKSALKAASVQNFRWHDLRHTFASRLVMGGVDLNTVRELLGHADYQMTLRYAHLAPEHKAAAVEKLVAA
jgi:integrase